MSIDKDLKESNKLLALYNVVPNLVWSIINLTPISIYCYNHLDQKIFYIFLGTSFIPIFFKNVFLDSFKIGKTTAVYKKLGVHFINKFAQNGQIINALVKKKYPNHKIIAIQKLSISKLINQTYIFEKFHLILFLFYSFTMVEAIINSRLTWALIIVLTNIVYNIYPNLLQQYIRIKLTKFKSSRQIL
ncbi:hypothetical protein [Pedobacter mucosus]|uniref:glycosyl-4,4'-diaponeurosporenoate acyltransferase CrtO family protein n=1 Tax=Pedobacter mucosus TaxID=2895286 RepID=UPI001EE3FE8F|nr:hypothetical protein [Pedobacter mucosus]UKT64478.1 hypothetical protein LOK61_01570 [Pedobacter mucosus]